MTLKKQKFVLGLDIGNCSVKIAEAVLENELILKSCQLFPFPQGKPISPDFLKKTLENKDIKNYKIVASLQGQGVILRHLVLPKIKKEELKGALKFELEKNIPFSIDDVIIDGQMIKNLDDKVLVLAAAVKNSFIEDFLAFLEKSGVYPDIVDICSIALVNSFNHALIENKKKTSALLNLGCNFTNLSILKNDMPYFNRDIPIGSSLLTKKIADSFNISFDEAEKIKLNPKDKINDIMEICEPILEDLVTEIKFSFDYFENKEDANIESVYLSGGMANSPVLEKFLGEAVGLECKTWDPFSNFKKSDDFDEGLIGNSVYYSIALGLVLRG